MQKIPSDAGCIQKFKPDFEHVLYKTDVAVVGNNLSGVLLIKKMPDSSTRIVFSSQMGISFFDFGFLPGNEFKVYQILPKMDKKALIKTLRKDFELIMFKNTDSTGSYSLVDSSGIYHAFPQSQGVNYYITDAGCLHLIKMQRSSDKKPVMEAFMDMESGSRVPDSISIHHLNFNFTINLKKITPLVTE